MRARSAAQRAAGCGAAARTLALALLLGVAGALNSSPPPSPPVPPSPPSPRPPRPSPPPPPSLPPSPPSPPPRPPPPPSPPPRPPPPPSPPAPPSPPPLSCVQAFESTLPTTGTAFNVTSAGYSPEAYVMADLTINGSTFGALRSHLFPPADAARMCFASITDSRSAQVPSQAGVWTTARTSARASRIRPPPCIHTPPCWRTRRWRSTWRSRCG